MNCRAGCAACCIYISISSTIPGMEGGKPAGVKCVHLNEHHFCILHGSSLYPEVCRNFTPTLDVCGSNAEQAAENLTKLEKVTNPKR